MGENEKKLLELQDAAEWSVPTGITEAIDALRTIDEEYSKIASQTSEMKGKAAEAASDSLNSDQKTVIKLGDAFEPLDELVARANRRVETARKAYADLPDTTVDLPMRIAITAGSFIFGPLVPLAAQAGLDAYEAWLREKREEKAKEAVSALDDHLSDDSTAATDIAGSMPKVREPIKDEDDNRKITWSPSGPVSDPTTNPAPGPGPGSGPSDSTGTEHPFMDGSDGLGIDDEGTVITDPGPGGTVVENPHTGDGGTDDHTDDADESGSTRSHTSVDGSVDTGRVSTGGSTATGGHVSSGSHSSDGSSSSQNGKLSVDSSMSSGVSGGLAGSAALVGGSRLAAQLAAKTAKAAGAAAGGASGGGGGLAGSVGSGFGPSGSSASGSGSTGATGGLGGRTGGAAAAGARGAAAEATEGRAGAGARGGSSVMAPGGGSGGSDDKKRAAGLLGLKAPTLDDDGNPRARSSAAGPGGRGTPNQDGGE